MAGGRTGLLTPVARWGDGNDLFHSRDCSWLYRLWAFVVLGLRLSLAKIIGVLGKLVSLSGKRPGFHIFCPMERREELPSALRWTYL